MKKRKPSKAKWVIPAILLALVLALAGALAAYLVTPGAARPQVGSGNILLSMEEDGSVRMTWPEAPDGAVSRVTLRSGGEQGIHLVQDYDGNTAVLEGNVLNQSLRVRIQSVTSGTNLLGMERELVSRGGLEVTVKPRNLPRPTLEGETGQAGELHLRWNGSGSYELCTVEDGQYQAIRRVSGDKTTLRFGGEGEMELPGYDQPVRITVRASYQGEGYVLCGPYAEPLAVEREALLGSVLSLECREVDERQYELRWNETKGDYYQVQEWSGDRWETLARVERTEELRYETGLLRSGSDHRYRVAVVNGGEGEDVEPAEVSLRAAVSPLYATIWPVVDVTLYEDGELGKSLARVPAGTALCVLEEGDGSFQVRYKDRYGYVDSRFCLINLPEYVGDVCAYDVTNSYSSIFMVHDYPIQNVTGKVVQGFEGIRTEEDGFLVPYLYPSAKKLLKAARAAEEDGYRLRIYEAFRPNEATRFLYDTMLSQLDYPVPERGENGEYVFYEPPEPVPEPEAGTEAAPSPEEEPEPTLPPEETAGVESEGGLQEETPAPQQPPQETAPAGPTYRQIMTDGRFGISSFLAASVSAHNRGIALDLTIEQLDGTPLEMQSAMHDLSWYSAASRNNDNAKLLESYMTGVGMRGLSGEWWHFQDDAALEAIGLSKYLYKGVTAEGWTRDNVGWRYRAADGSFRKSTNITVDGKQYTLDQEGYAVE